LSNPKRPKVGRPKGRKEAYTYPKTTLYWKTVGDSDLQKIAAKYCKEKGPSKVNDFVMQAIHEKLCREGYIRKK
jgi:hypothetical protein